VRTFQRLDDVSDLVPAHFGSDRRLVALDRLTGGSKKGVYRLRLDDATTAILYVWSDEENYWPAAEAVPDDPFTDATGAELFEVNHAALVAAGVRVPDLMFFDRAAGLALVEDAGTRFLEGLMADDPAAAQEPLAGVAAALRRMHTTYHPQYGKIADIARGAASQARRPEDVIEDRALRHLDEAAGRDRRLADARHRIADHLAGLRAAVAARHRYGLVHGELGPDHVLVNPAGEPVMIDFEGLAYFDVEWDHAWIRMRFEEAYPRLDPVELDPHRLEFYRYAQVLSLIESPLRIAETDFPDRDWMLALAEWNIAKALAVL
jgi:hypothetical protein